MENVILDPFPSEKNLEHIRRLQGEGLAHSTGFGSPHSSTGARWALGVVKEIIQFGLHLWNGSSKHLCTSAVSKAELNPSSWAT